jgi:hypothetical protein
MVNKLSGGLGGYLVKKGSNLKTLMIDPIARNKKLPKEATKLVFCKKKK